MPKERRDRSVSVDRYKASPFPSSHEGRYSAKLSAETEENLKEWEEARCPVCMEHPHNAVLLICSSHDKGCRPFMCDTSYRHSNCLDQYCKSSSQTPSTAAHQENQLSAAESSSAVSLEGSDGLQGRAVDTAVEVTISENPVQPNLVCPLCRGKIKEWIVVESARNFMNAKARSCACESCNFSGNYSDLRKHARLEHPLARPTEADPQRQRNWRRLERQRDLGDLLSTLQSTFGEERAESGISSSNDDGGWLTVYFLIRVFRPRTSPRGSSWSATSSTRTRSGRRRSARLWGESVDGDNGSSSREDNDSSDSETETLTWSRRVRRRLSPEDQS